MGRREGWNVHDLGRTNIACHSQGLVKVSAWLRRVHDSRRGKCTVSYWHDHA
jgi:hypothetical protein